MRPWQSAAASVFYMSLPKITRGISARELAFSGFCAVGCVAWTSRLPAAERMDFINDVLDRYQEVAGDHSGEENTFKFYQMDISLLAISEKEK